MDSNGVSTYSSQSILVIDSNTQNILKSHSVFVLLSFDIDSPPFLFSTSLASLVAASDQTISFNVLK